MIETDFGFWYDGNAAERQDPAGRNASVGYLSLELSLELQEQLNTLMLPFLVLIGLAFAVAVDPYVKKPVKQVMLLIDAIELSIILACCISNGLEAAWTPAYVTVQTALSAYCCRNVTSWPLRLIMPFVNFSCVSTSASSAAIVSHASDDVRVHCARQLLEHSRRKLEPWPLLKLAFFVKTIGLLRTIMMPRLLPDPFAL